MHVVLAQVVFLSVVGDGELLGNEGVYGFVLSGVVCVANVTVLVTDGDSVLVVQQEHLPHVAGGEMHSLHDGERSTVYGLTNVED